jgi:hypothetical protein
MGAPDSMETVGWEHPTVRKKSGNNAGLPLKRFRVIKIYK